VFYYPKYINKQLLATNPNLYLVPALYPVNTIYKDEALTNILQESCPNRLQKEGSEAKSLCRTALL
jgi:hypothetical protein